LGWAGQNPPPGEERFPVRGVTWFEALEYCRWLGEQTGRAYSLPSEGQWLRAAFGAAPGTPAPLYPWGAEWQAGRSNTGGARPAAVDAFPPQSASGASDWVGNVLQWTTTLWGEQRLAPDPRYAPPWRDDGRDDLHANRQVRRVARGSSYKDAQGECTPAIRHSFLPDDRGQPGKRIGLRVVVNPGR
jgi:formylglycine-generating enzyme required for sulfatase activity